MAGKMRLHNKDKKIFGPIILVVLFVCATLIFSAGCEKKQAIKVGDTTPRISGNDIHGEDISQSKLKAKLVVIYFWTNSCCGESLKTLEPLYIKNRDKGLAVLAVNVGDKKEIVESYAKSNALTFSMLTDEHSKLFEQFHVFGFPTIFILDKNSIVREKILGDIPIEKLQKLVERQFNIQKEIEANYEKIHSR
jgi:peroxiredoxin